MDHARRVQSSPNHVSFVRVAHNPHRSWRNFLQVDFWPVTNTGRNRATLLGL